MRAARLHEGANTLSVEEIEKPEIGPNELLVGVQAASICGSDVHHLSGELPINDDKRPLTLGHEGAGRVVETGESVECFEGGDRVVINYIVSCGTCDACLRGYDNRCRNRKSVGSDLPGTFAEYIAIPVRSAIRLPDAVPYEWGSIASCAVSTAFHTIQRSEVEKNDRVVVFGIGGVGLHAVLFASRSLARDVIAVDPVETKLETAEEFGADVTIDPSNEDPVDAINDLTDDRGVDVALECSGSPIAMRQAIESVNGANKFSSGTVVSVGYQTEHLEVSYWGLREGQLLVAGDHTRSELARLVSLLESGKVDLSDSISDHIELDDIQTGMERVADNDTHGGRVIVEP